ncbi:MAG TPA: hypothetical protein VLE99_02570, partial [Candidatus Saccharimonadales bacterium]|nr:hypothetical protein [Candidatus Saccharimonadales bacterium]
AVKTGWAWAGAQVLRVRDWLSDKERDGERQRRRVVASVLGGAATILAIATGVYLANRGQHIPPASAGPGLPAAAPTPPVDLSLAYSGDTVWDGVSSFAHSQGVNLTGSELRDVVGRVLHDNHQTWASARYLPVGYRYVLSPAEINGLNTSE